MAYSEEKIKNVVKKKLEEISESVINAFKPNTDPPQAMSEDEVNEKVAHAVAVAFTQFKTDAVVSILKATGKVTPAGVVDVDPHTGASHERRLRPRHR